jgi:hypothetical protein
VKETNPERVTDKTCALKETWIMYNAAYSALEVYLHSGIDEKIPTLLKQGCDAASDAISVMTEENCLIIHIDNDEESPMTDKYFKRISDVFGFHHAKCSQIYAAIKTCRLVLNGRA